MVGHDLNMMITNNVVIKVKVNIQHENKNDVAGIDCMDRWSEKLDNIHSLPLSLFFLFCLQDIYQLYLTKNVFI